MTHVLSRKRAAVSAATFALLTLSACMSEMPRQLPTEPTPAYTYPPSYTPVLLTPVAAARSEAAANRTKYRDSGAKPARVRVASAALEMRALLGGDGMTLVEATTGSFDGEPANGIIDKVQLKALTAEPTTFNERVGKPEWTHNVPGLVSGDVLQLTAHVKGARGQGTRAGSMEIITISTATVRRPDLAVLSVDGAAQAHSGESVTFFATVAELNGEMGARANCVLRINGEPVDEAAGIWVDANGLVTCQFSYVFATTGTFTVEVGAADAQPLDWSEANNVKSTSITIVTAGTPIAFGQLTVEDAAYTYLNTATRSGTYPLESSSGGSEMWSKVTVFGTSVTPVPGPLQRVTAKVTTGATTIYESSITSLMNYRYVSGGANVECVDFNSNGETAQSCTSTFSDGTGSTWFSYGHQSGTVTYYGQTLYCNTFGCNTYKENGADPSGWGQRYGLSAGSNVRVQLTFFDASALAHVIDKSATLQDISGSVNFDTGLSCAPYWDGLGEVCARQQSSGTVWRGLTNW